MKQPKSMITGLKAKSEMSTNLGKDVTKIKVKNSGVNMPKFDSKPQSLKARSLK